MKACRILASATVAFAAATIVSTAVVSPARAQSAADFYKGKTVNIVVGFTTGGGFDANARLLARHIGKYIPGNPNVIVQNMPGAASLTSVQYLDATAPKDGTVIDTYNFGQIIDAKMSPERIKVDFRKFNWIGSISVDLSACFVWNTIPGKTLEDFKKHGQLNFGLTGTGTSNDVNTRIIKNIFGMNIKQIAGYPGSAEQKLAVERGELDGGCGNWSSMPPDWIAEKKFTAFIKSSNTTPPDMDPSVPWGAAIAPNDHARELIKFILGAGEVGRPYMMSLSVPADRVKIVRDAFDKSVKDPAFIADADKLRLPVSPKNGAESLKVIEDLYSVPDSLVAEAKKIVTQ
jgi:tripartite-type tricarboxylate transporter receptor subunit TctC